MKRSEALRLLRHGCNLAELEAWFSMTPLDARKAVKALELTVARRIRSEHHARRMRHRPAIAA